MKSYTIPVLTAIIVFFSIFAIASCADNDYYVSQKDVKSVAYFTEDGIHFTYYAYIMLGEDSVETEVEINETTYDQLSKGAFKGQNIIFEKCHGKYRVRPNQTKFVQTRINE